MYPIHQLSDSLINLAQFFFFLIVSMIIILQYKSEEGERRVERVRKRDQAPEGGTWKKSSTLACAASFLQ